MIFQPNVNEEVKIVVRRHWASLINLVAFTLLMSILPIVLYFILDTYIHLSQGAFNLFVIGVGIYYMFVVNMFFIGWVDYYLDAAIITNERIIDIDQEGLFNRTVSEVNLTRVQDATGFCKGIMESFLDFGDVQVQTAGAAREFILEKIPKPYKIAKLIIDMQHEAINGNNHNGSTTETESDNNNSEATGDGIS